MKMNSGNLFDSIPQALPQELVEPLLHAPGVRIERIVSRGHGSPAGFWYEQEEGEWVLLVQGQACLEFVDQTTVNLRAGDYLNIPPGRRHRVAWTSREPEALWVTVFYPEAAAEGQGAGAQTA